MGRLCESCDEQPGNRKCSACSQAWYCSKQCQKVGWFHHKFDCPGGNPTTADYLAMACVKNLIPTHEQTIIDYGFERAFTGGNRSKLLGLYTGLTNEAILNVSAKTLHRWRKNGVLIPEIKKRYESLPLYNRGGYYPWFLENEWVLDGKTPEEWGRKEAAAKHGEDLLKAGWIYAGGSPTTAMTEIKETTAKWPLEKRKCYQLCSMLLSKMYPSPYVPGLWIAFGFCTCKSLYDEINLSQYYRTLLRSYTFEELHAAFATSQLYDLFLAQDLGPQLQRSHPLLKDVLAMPPATNLSVWDLKAFLQVLQDAVEDDSGSLRPCISVMVDYGFVNCKTEDELNGLKNVYATLFEKTEAKPPELHRACIEGKLYDFVAKWVKITEKKKYKRLMKNPYPLNFPPISSI